MTLVFFKFVRVKVICLSARRQVSTESNLLHRIDIPGADIIDTLVGLTSPALLPVVVRMHFVMSRLANDLSIPDHE